MSIITRRRFMESLAFGISAGVTQAHASKSTEIIRHKRAIDREGVWYIARQKRQVCERHVVDFWSKPLCSINYATCLPAEIVQGILWYDSEEHSGREKHILSNTVDSIVPQNWSACFNEGEFFESRTGIKNLTESLRSLIGETSPAKPIRRTALLALDSQCVSAADPTWADTLPAFRRCYDRVIGHFHIERRGFYHWKTWLSDSPFDAGYFERVFTKAALQCDAIILTSQSLAENDTFLSARASTETLVGELMRRFSEVLLHENTLTEVAPIGTLAAKPMTRPRIFALGSAGATESFRTVDEKDLLRQRALVFSSFGKPILRPLLIAIDADEACAETIRTQILGTNILFLTTKVGPRRHRREDCFDFEFVTLWPFDPDYGPWL
jgi:hypothetical protein